MAIIAYTGLPGDGKSYGVVDNVILKNLRAGRVVWSNIPMHADVLEAEIPGHRFHQIPPYDDTWKTGEALSAVPKGCILVLDELWTVLPSGMKANQIPQAWKSYFAEHRHAVGDDGFSSEIVIVTQDLADVAAFARNKVQKTFIVRKLWAAGLNNRFIVDCYRGAITGQRGAEAAKVGTATGIYDPAVYRFYQSHTKGGGQVGHEVVADQRGVVWKHPLIRIGIPLAAVAVLAAVFFGYRALGNITGKPAHELPDGAPAPVIKRQAARRVVDTTPAQRIEQTQAVTPAAAEQIASGVEYSKRWRVAGFVKPEHNPGVVILVDDARVYRYVPQADCEQVGPLPDEWACDVDGLTATSFTGQPAGWLPSLVKPSS